MASEKNLQELFHEMLKDIYFAEEKILSALPEMARAAQSQELKAAFELHETETEEHVARLERVFKEIDETPSGKTCDAIIGIIGEGQEVMKQFKDVPALDAGLLAAAQAVEHYEIARYGTLKTWAGELGLNEAVKLLETTLAEEDRRSAHRARAERGQSARASGLTPDRKSFPPREDCRGVCGLYLLRIAGVVEPHQHIVPFVRGAVYCVTHDDNAIANIDRVQHGRQHTNIGLRSREDQRVCLALAQVLDQPGFGEGGIACFVDKRRGRAKRGQRHQLQQLEIEAFAGMVICPCVSDCLVG